MKFKTEAEIIAEINEARIVVEKLQQSLPDRQEMDPAERLAMDLHAITCPGIYVGRCDWGNGGGWDRNYEMKDYLERASNLLTVTTHENALEMLRMGLGR